MEMLMKRINKSKIKVYITIEPFGLRIGAVFKAKDHVGDIALFVNRVLNKLGIKYELGRIEISEKRAILLDEYVLEEFVENEEEITVYSREYGLQMKTLPGDGNDQKLPYFQRVELLYEDNSSSNSNNHNEVKKVKKNINENVIKEDKTKIISSNNSHTKDNNSNNNIVKVNESKHETQVNNVVEHSSNNNSSSNSNSENNVMEKAILKSQQQVISPTKTKHVYKELIADSDDSNDNDEDNN